MSGLCAGTNGVNELSLQESISVYPNPSSGIFTIQMDNGKLPINNCQLSIYNLLGENVYERTTKNEKLSTTIDLSKQETGIYFLQMKSGNKSFSKKIVIVR